MTAVMMGLHKTLPAPEREPLPPRQITENVVSAVAPEEAGDEPIMLGATFGAHFAYGALAAAPYAAFAAASHLNPLAKGALYGAGVWAGSYFGLVPATGLYRSAKEESAHRNALMIASHLVWGACLGVLYGAWRERR